MSSDRVGARSSRVVALMCVLLWALASLWLAGGVAHADDTSDSGGTSQSSADANTSDPKPSDTKPSDTEPSNGEPDPAENDAKPLKKPRSTRKHGHTPGDTTSSSATRSTPATALSTPDPTPDAKPAPKKTAAQSTATVGTSSTTAPTTVSLKLVAPSVNPPAGASTPNPVKQAVQFARQMAGLANDVTLLAVTVVHNLAAAAATTIGKQAFWGVPYNIANSIAGTAATAGKLLTGTPLNAHSDGPYKVTYGVGDLLNYVNPNRPPAGANDPDITVTQAHPLPIILIHGTAANAPFNWSVGAPVLANAGYKVYTFNYGNVTDNPAWPVRGTADIDDSARELAHFVDEVLGETQADKVILIGHSQGGGMTPTYYINNLGGAEKVSQFIGIAPGHHGADVDGLAYIQYIPLIGKPLLGLMDLLGPAWRQQAIGSPLIDEIYGNGDTRPGVLYTTISTTFDWIVTPYTNQALDGPNVTNIVLQDQYPGFNAGHLGIVFAAPTWDAVLGALAANPAANPVPVTAAA